MTAVRSLLRALGPAGVLALGVGFFCAPFYVSALAPAERELASLRAGPAHAAPEAAPANDREAALEQFRRQFPPADHLADELERIYRLGRDAGLDLMQGEYRVERAAAGLVPYRISLPVRGSYPQLRAFIGAVLTEVPFASVDTLRFERRKSADAQLEAQVRLTVYFRAAQRTP